MARTLLAALVVLAGCSAESRFFEHELAPGDAVIAASLDEDRAEIARADASGRVMVSWDPARAPWIAVVRARDVVGPDGAPAPLDQLRVDLEGDTSASCGCSAPALDLPQRVVAGDRCALPAAIALAPASGPDDDDREHDLRAKLRLSWPGACTSRPPAREDARSLVVCPLGDPMRRVAPVRTTIAADGTLVGVARSRAIEIDPAGAVHETAIEPALRRVNAALAIGARGTLVVSDGLGLLSERRTELTWLPARGARPAVRLLGMLPQQLRAYGVLRAPVGPDDLWIHGSATESITTEGALARCRIGADDTIACTHLRPQADAHCPSFGRDAITGMATLAGDELVGIAGDGRLFLLHDGAPRCLPEADALPFRALDGVAIDVDDAPRFTASGRRVVACLSGVVAGGEELVVVATATVGAWGASAPVITWHTVAETRSATSYCGDATYVDPRRPDRLVVAHGSREVQHAVIVARTATAVEARDTENEDLFPELDDGFSQIATSSRTVGITSGVGSMWSAALGDGALRPRLSFDPPGLVRAHGVVPTDSGFRVAAGRAIDVAVTVPAGDGCDGITVTASRDAYDEEDEDPHDDTLVLLGERVLRFGRRDGAQQLAVGDRVIPLPGEAIVRSAAEIVPGAWAAFVRDDGALWATDGVSAAPLDDGADARWARVSGAGGVGWAASTTELARVLPASGGGLRIERDVLARVERSRFDALMRDRAPVLVAVRALASGGALLAFQEALAGTVQGGIDDVTVWWLTSERGRLVLSRYDALTDRGSRPLSPQIVAAIMGPDATPLLMFAGSEQSVGLHAPGAPLAALPFSSLVGVATRGRDVLAIGGGLRMAVVRVR